MNVSSALTSTEPETSKYSWSRYLNMSTQTPPSRRHQRPSMQVDSAEDGDDDDDDDDDEDNNVDVDSDGKDNENDNLIESDEEGEATTHFVGSAGCSSGSVGADAYKPHASTSDAAKARDRHADRVAKLSSI
ncbi:PREDICTED: nucleolar transcription factor 1-like [Bactrocera latifrons]|uniref:nucleolar transcription factor 1-like n=1 Tax=Bactrocera latifrons TaxID=174628 RepID=UPI0008DDB421|nr:PREDICTED: nucleolar transcription factor 1-like [Bactrocera latifrons]